MPYCDQHERECEQPVDCRLQAEKDMYLSGEYSERADPFRNHLAPEPVDRIARDGGYEWDGGWVVWPPKDAS